MGGQRHGQMDGRVDECSGGGVGKGVAYRLDTLRYGIVSRA